MVVPALLGEAGAGDGATAAPPTLDPGWFVGRSVPAACGKLFVVFGDDSLDPPAGGFWVVVREFCASAEAAPRMANARTRVFIVKVPPLINDVKACRTSRVSLLPRQRRAYPFYWMVRVNPDQTDIVPSS